MQQPTPRPTLLAALGALGALLLIAAASPAQARTHWPISAYWSFDAKTVDGHTVHDLGPNHFDGKIGKDGGPSVSFVQGVHGQAVKFHKHSHAWIQITHPPRHPFVLHPPFTIMAWAKPAGRGTQDVLSQSTDSTKPGFRFTFSNQRFMAIFNDGPKRITVRPSVVPLSPGHWTLVAVVHNGRKVTLFMDGEPVASQPAPSPLTPSDRTAFIGNYAAAAHGYAKNYAFVGLLDELVVFDRALTNEQMIRFADTVLKQ